MNVENTYLPVFLFFRFLAFYNALVKSVNLILRESAFKKHHCKGSSLGIFFPDLRKLSCNRNSSVHSAALRVPHHSTQHVC